MNVEDLIGAVRATDGDDPELAAATQLRVRRSLETRVRSRHQLADAHRDGSRIQPVPQLLQDANVLGSARGPGDRQGPGRPLPNQEV